MANPLSSKDVIDFLKSSNFNAEPIYVKTPSGDVIELTKMSFMSLDDENEDQMYPVFYSQYTDIVLDSDYTGVYGRTGIPS